MREESSAAVAAMPTRYAGYGFRPRKWCGQCSPESSTTIMARQMPKHPERIGGQRLLVRDVDDRILAEHDVGAGVKRMESSG